MGYPQSIKHPEIIGARRQVPLLNGRLVPQIFLDNAASTKPFQAVKDFLDEMLPYYSNIHRGTGFDSSFCTERYEEARDIVGEFVGWDAQKDVVVPVRNTTEGLNLLANTIQFEPGERAIATISEHHSNDLPWRSRAQVDYLPIDDSAQLVLAELERLLTVPGRVRVVSITGASNVTGTVSPIDEIAAIAHQYGALVVVDGAQLIPHRRFTMKPHEDPSHIDFVVFSGHKMNCPFRVSAVVGRRDVFDDAPPYQSGGGTVYSVSLNHVMWAAAPEKQEAGTPNILGLFALAKTIQIMEAVGMEAIATHERQLTALLLQGLSRIPQVEILGSSDSEAVENRVGVVSFQIAGIHHALVGAILSYEWGIAVRHGCFCAHPLIKHLLKVSREQESHFEAEIRQGRRDRVPGAVRASLGIHNTAADVEKLVEAVACIARGQWQGNYQQDLASGEFLPENFRFEFHNLPGFASQPQLGFKVGKIKPFPSLAASIILLLMAGTGLTGWWLSSRLQDKEWQPSNQALATLLNVETPFSGDREIVVSKSQPIQGDRTFTGTVESAESVTLTSRVAGQIKQLTVEAGDSVNAGQVIALIDVKDLQAQKAQGQATVAIAQAAKINTQSQLNRAQSLWSEARAQLSEAEAELADAQLNQQRMAQLQADGVVSQAQLDEANTRVTIVKTEIEQAQAQIQQSQAEIKQAQAQVQQAQAQVKQAQAQVEQAVANLDYGVVKAPFAGIVTRKHTEVGALAGEGESLVTIENRQKLRLRVEIPESLIARVQPGQLLPVHLDSLGKVVNGRVEQIIAAANPHTRNITVKIALESQPNLISGMFGRLKLTTSDRIAVTIPQTALVQQMGLTGVLRVVGENTQFQPVTTGVVQQEDIEIISGLQAGEKVILNF